MISLEEMNDIEVDKKAAKPKPTMSWAEMAKSEGHRRGVPNIGRPAGGLGNQKTQIMRRRSRIANFIRANGEKTIREVSSACKVTPQQTKKDLCALRKMRVVCVSGTRGRKYLYKWVDDKGRNQ